MKVGSGLIVTSDGTVSIGGSGGTGAGTGGQQSKIVFVKNKKDGGNPSPTYTPYEIWRCNYDGSGMEKINVPFPSNGYVSVSDISPDGKTIFLAITEYTNTAHTRTKSYLASCNIDGSGYKKLMEGDEVFGYENCQAY